MTAKLSPTGMTLYPLGRPQPIGDTSVPDLISAVQTALASIGSCNESIRHLAATDLVQATLGVLRLLIPQE